MPFLFKFVDVHCTSSTFAFLCASSRGVMGGQSECRDKSVSSGTAVVFSAK